MILLIAVAVSIVIALAFGGRLSQLAGISLRYGWLALVSVALQLTIVYADLPDTAGPVNVRLALMLTAYALLIGMVLANRRLPGFWWIGLGMALNLTAMLANGGWMPVAPESLERAGLSHLAVSNASGARVLGSKDVVLSHDEANLWALGDVFVTRWPLPTVFSIGDILLAGGAFWFFWRTTRPTMAMAVERTIIDI